MAGEVPNPCRIYRIVHFANLELLLQDKGLHCGNAMASFHPNYLQVGDQKLTRDRGQTQIPVGPKGCLSDYVPFYFCPRSIMLYQIHTGAVSTYQGGQEPILHLVTAVHQIRNKGLKFIFTDVNARMRYARFFEDCSDLAELDWEAIKSQAFNRRDDDPDRPSRKQAEFLVHRFVPWDCIAGIGVINKKWKDDCEVLLARYGITTPVKICTGWYF